MFLLHTLLQKCDPKILKKVIDKTYRKQKNKKPKNQKAFYLMFDWHLHCLLSGRLMMMSLWIRRAMGRSTLDQIISSEATCFYTLCWTAGLIRSHCLGCITFVCWIVSRLLHQHRLRIDDDSMPETPPSVHGLWLPGGLPAESDGQEHLGSNHFIWSYMLLYSLLDCRFDPFSLSWLHHVCLLNCLPSASSTPPQDRWRQHAWDTA